MQYPEHHRQPRAADRLLANISAAVLAANWTDDGNGKFSFNAGGQPSGAEAGGVILQVGWAGQVAVEGVGIMFWTGEVLARPTKVPNNGTELPVIAGTDAGKIVVLTDGLPSVPANAVIEAFLTAADQAANWAATAVSAKGEITPDADPEVDSHTIEEGELVGVAGINGGVYKLTGGKLVPFYVPEHGQVFDVTSGTVHAGNTTAFSQTAGFPDPT